MACNISNLVWQTLNLALRTCITSIDVKLFISGTPYTITYNVSAETGKICVHIYVLLLQLPVLQNYSHNSTYESIAITQPIFLFNRLLKSRRRNRLMKKVSKLPLQCQTIHFLTLTLPPPNYCHTVSFTTRSIGGVNKQTLPAGPLQLHIQSCEEIECKYYINVAGLVLSIYLHNKFFRYYLVASKVQL